MLPKIRDVLFGPRLTLCALLFRPGLRFLLQQKILFSEIVLQLLLSQSAFQWRNPAFVAKA
jgi:hypothetical protein